MDASVRALRLRRWRYALLARRQRLLREVRFPMVIALPGGVRQRHGPVNSLATPMAPLVFELTVNSRPAVVTGPTRLILALQQRLTPPVVAHL